MLWTTVLERGFREYLSERAYGLYEAPKMLTKKINLEWSDAYNEIDDLDTMSDYEESLDANGIEDFEEGFIRGYASA